MGPSKAHLKHPCISISNSAKGQNLTYVQQDLQTYAKMPIYAAIKPTAARDSAERKAEVMPDKNRGCTLNF